MRLLLPCLVAEFTRPKLQLGNDMRILAGHDGDSLRIEHVRYQHPDAHVDSSPVDLMV
jgi:hypothetical protein